MDVGGWSLELVPESESVGGDEEDDGVRELDEGASGELDVGVCGFGGEEEECEDGGGGDGGAGDEKEGDEEDGGGRGGGFRRRPGIGVEGEEGGGRVWLVLRNWVFSRIWRRISPHCSSVEEKSSVGLNLK